jgi:hypothetical protein
MNVVAPKGMHPHTKRMWDSEEFQDWARVTQFGPRNHYSL